MKKLRLLLNIGTADRDKLGLKETLVTETRDGRPTKVKRGTQEGDTVTVSDAVAKEMLARGWAELASGEPSNVPLAPPKQATEAPAGITVPPDAAVSDEEEAAAAEEADASPVSDENAHDAIDQISRIRSRDKLQSIIDNDKRQSVQDAARTRLAAL